MRGEKLKKKRSHSIEEERGITVVPDNKEGANEGPTVIFPGLGETVKNGGAFSTPVKVYAEASGEKVLAPQDPRAKEALADIEVTQRLFERKEHARNYFKDTVDSTLLKHVLDTIPLGQFRKALNAMEFLIPHLGTDEKPHTIPKVIAHSQGGVVAPLCALFWPEYFEGAHLVLLNPAGFTAASRSKERQEQSRAVKASEKVKRSRLEILKNMFSETPSFLRYFGSLIASGKIGALLDALYDNFLSGRAFQRLDDAYELLQYDATPLMQLLVQSGNKVTVAYGEKDILFPRDLFESQIDTLADVEFKKIKGGHFEIIENPEESAETLKEIFKK